MTPLAPHLTAFFQERLTLERQASINTCDSYAYAFKLLLNFASKRLKVAPSRLAFEQLDAPLVVAFLNDLGRANARMRPVRAMCVLQRSGHSCGSWNTAHRLLLNKSSVSLLFPNEENRYAPSAAPQYGRDPGASRCA